MCVVTTATGTVSLLMADKVTLPTTYGARASQGDRPAGPALVLWGGGALVLPVLPVELFDVSALLAMTACVTHTHTHTRAYAHTHTHTHMC